MNDYKELIKNIKGDAAFRHIISECGADGRVWFDKRFICDYVSHLKYAIEQLIKERNVPVAHGHWVHLGGDEWCCSNCGDVIHTEGSWERPTGKYCAECGAKMDEEVEHETN